VTRGALPAGLCCGVSAVSSACLELAYNAIARKARKSLRHLTRQIASQQRRST
jgi:hypothetical protein